MSSITSYVRGSASATGTAATAVLAAPSKGRLYVNAVQVIRTDAGATTIYITLNDSAASVIGIPAGGGNNVVFPTPLQVAALTALTFTASVGVTTLFVNAQGFTTP